MSQTAEQALSSVGKQRLSQQFAESGLEATNVDKIYREYIPPPPLYKRKEYVTDDTATDGDIARDSNGHLLRRYMDYSGITGDIIESFDNWVENILPEQLYYNPVVTGAGKVRINGIVLYKPTISRETSRGTSSTYGILTPHMARQKSLTYAGKLTGNVEFVDFDDNVQSTLKDVVLGYVPVMLGSSACHLQSATPEEKLEYGECAEDPFGYFVIGGAEYGLHIQEKLRLNRFLMYHEGKAGVIIKLTSDTLSGTKLTKISLDKNSVMNLTFKMLIAGSGMSVNPLQVFRVFGYSTEDILGLVGQFVSDKNYYRVLLALQETISAYEKIGDDFQAINKQHTGSAGRKTKKTLSHDDILQDFQKSLFPHMDEEDLDGKLQLLAMMVAQYGEYLAGVRKITDRDNWSNKLMESAGRLMEKLFSLFWERVVVNNLSGANILGPGDFRNEYNRQVNQSNKSIVDIYTKAFTTNNWGIDTVDQEDSNVPVRLERETTLLTYADLTKINVPTDRKGKQFPARMVHLSQTGYVDPFETPEGKNCGLNKAKAVTCRISLKRNDTIVRQYIEENDALVDRRDDEGGKTTPCLLNGKMLGWCSGEALRDRMQTLRRQGQIPRDALVVLSENTLFVYTDGSRPVRPLLIVDKDNTLVLDKKKRQGVITGDSTFVDLLEHSCVEYLDPFEQEYARVAQNVSTLRAASLELTTTKQQISELEDRLEQGEKVSKELEKARDAYRKKRYTHAEMDPNAMFGISASIIPYANHNQAPRIAYQCKMGTQAAGLYHSNYHIRFDGSANVLSYPTQPLVTTQLTGMLGLDTLPAGEDIVLAIMTYTGYAQEDAIVVNQGSLDRGRFRSVFYVTYTTTTKKKERSSFSEKLAKYSSAHPYRNLDENGLPIVGSFLNVGDAVIGKKRTLTPKKGQKTVEDASEFITVDKEGVVDRVYVSRNADGNFVVKVKIKQERIPQVGDKFASRHAQKSTIGLILPEESMPYTADGMRPDIIINPHAIPSRMTIGKLMEMVASKTGALKGERINATAFQRFDLEEFQRNLYHYGFQQQGKQTMYSGFTGKRLQSQIFIGLNYYQRLRHFAKEKIQARGHGPVSTVFHTPVSGKNRGGGLRMGYMEKNSAMSHGASSLVQERMCYSSDKFETVFCKSCGSIAVSNYQDKYITCQRCGDSSEFGKCAISRAGKVLVQHLLGAGISLKTRVAEEQ
jgi:DNA-directed RNA polymerase II subunit RPB2